MHYKFLTVCVYVVLDIGNKYTQIYAFQFHGNSHCFQTHLYFSCFSESLEMVDLLIVINTHARQLLILSDPVKTGSFIAGVL